MVKLFGPAMSQGAAGKLGGSLVFANTKRGAYAKKLTRPKQPRSEAQVSIRAMVKFLSQTWAVINANNKATWETEAAARAIAPYHFYLGHNMERWRNKRTPTVNYPAEEEDTLSNDFDLAAYAGVRQARIRYKNEGAPPNVWIHLIFHSMNPGADTSWDHLVLASINDEFMTSYWWTHQNLVPGTHHYTSAVAQEDGKSNFTFTETSSCVVTDL